MGKNYKISINYFLLESIKISRTEIDMIQKGKIENSKLDGVFFFSKSNNEIAHPLYVQIVLRRQNTKFKSPGILINKQKVYNYSEYEKGDLIEMEKLEIEKLIRILNYSSQDFKLSGVGRFIEMMNKPIFTSIFDRQIKFIYKQVMSKTNNDLASVIDWKNFSLDEINKAVGLIIPNKELKAIMMLYKDTEAFSTKKSGQQYLVYQWIEAEKHYYYYEYLKGKGFVDFYSIYNNIHKNITDFLRDAIENAKKV